jgi:hypothetical protein
VSGFVAASPPGLGVRARQRRFPAPALLSGNPSTSITLIPAETNDSKDSISHRPGLPRPDFSLEIAGTAYIAPVKLLTSNSSQSGDCGGTEGEEVNPYKPPA